MKLVIAEKPSVAKVLMEMIERVEGEKFSRNDGYFQSSTYLVSWCVGHLVSLSDPAEYGWDAWKMEDLPMIPKEWKLQILPDTKKQFNTLKSLMQNAVLIINATDAGREGELIYGLVVEKANRTNKPQFRLWLNSFVPSDMEKAWKNLEPAFGKVPLYQSALCRAKADWLVGMNLSRGYSLGTGIRGLSVGRVQTPTLALIVNRDLEIENWKDRFYFMLKGYWRSLKFHYVKDGESKFNNELELKKVIEACEGKPATLKLFEKNSRKIFPPKPFDLSELQKAANRILGLKAATTLEIAQSLYEKKYLTYPRTDSQYLPDGMKEEALDILYKFATKPEKEVLRNSSEQFVFFNSAKVSDHFAIIPTGQEINLNALDEKERKVYNLVRSRFVLAFGLPYEFEEYKLGIDCASHNFLSRATRELNKGFKALFDDVKSKEEEKDESDLENKLDKSLDWKIGDSDVLKNLAIENKKATKPSRFNEATLLTAMETAGKIISDEAIREAMKERGLGTPATKAAIIETLKRREYISTEGKNLISTTKGRELIYLVDEKISSPEMTGEWEWKLNQIAKEKLAPQSFLIEIEDYVKSLGESYKSDKAAAFENKIQSENLTCPKCKTHKLVENSAGRFCQDKEKCGFKLWAKVGGKNLSDKVLETLIEKGKTGLIKGFTSKDGRKFDAILKLENWQVTFDFGSNQTQNSLETKEKKPDIDFGPCPKCGNKIIVGKFGPQCFDWKGCGFKIYNPMSGRTLSDTEIKNLIAKRITPVLEGFKSKEGKPFSAALKINEKSEVQFNYQST